MGISGLHNLLILMLDGTIGKKGKHENEYKDFYAS